MVTARFFNISFDNGIHIKSGSETIIVEISGHSGYGQKGFDVVCAGISALTQTVIASISKLIRIEQNIIKKDGLLKSEIIIKETDTEQNSKLMLILETLLIGLLEINKEYPGSVKIDFVTD
ncbi:MAG TPA: ribosomal-processing cysteine protease Prp [Spirochaetota bacterium]|nr:ribosomal-processing cysteine protease Prp [Spirochaetota bacterium]HOP62952.1 ribosomal-processing cysteine protease Prp [Spirochaetota bacterium]HPF05241.1 ribosomal-processing cysteine protease Prp [Spirochaetota bacterium]HPJ40857.1 ribosomal-processing cysteine protease Prp [Spirochaetota bacterium]HPR37166.1 ribosomal-processing cysteine protease Prp [Spirochaetota bacterium]